MKERVALCCVFSDGRATVVSEGDMVLGIMFRAIRTLHGERVLNVVDKQSVTKVYSNIA